MAFTFLSLTSLLILSTCDLSLAQFGGTTSGFGTTGGGTTFGGTGGGTSLGGSFPSYSTGGTGGIGGPGGFPGAGGSSSFLGGAGGFPQQQQRRRLATCRAQNAAGDKLYLNFLEVGGGSQQSYNPYTTFNPFARNFNQRQPSPQTYVKVTGLYVKSGADSGIVSQGSLRGTFTMVVTRNGNTAGACLGTGEPYIPQRYRQRPTNPLSNLLRGNPYARFLGGLGGAGGRGGFSAFGLGGQSGGSGFSNTLGGPFGHNPYSQIAMVSTPLQAGATTAAVDGSIQANIRELYGRSISVCLTKQCAHKTDLCCIIGADEMTVEEFAQYRNHQLAVIKAKTELAAGNNFLSGAGATTGGGLLTGGGTTGIDDDDGGLFTGGAGF